MRRKYYNLFILGLFIMAMTPVGVRADGYWDYYDYYEEENGEIIITIPNDNLATIDGVLIRLKRVF